MTNGHDFDATYADERRRAALAALELETRAQNAERALEHLRDEIASLRAVALGTPEHAGCVPLADVQQLLARCEARYEEGATASDVLDELSWFVIARTAAAKTEGGETGGE